MKIERLVLRRYAAKDKADFIQIFTDATVMQHVSDGVLTEAQAEAFWQKLFETLYLQGFNIWAVFTQKDSLYAGHAGIYTRSTRTEEWEFVYFFNRNSWGKGFATEIARRIIEYGFVELNLPAVYATVDDDHSASIRVLEKAQMKFERYEFDEDGRFSVYSIKKTRRE